MLFATLAVALAAIGLGWWGGSLWGRARTVRGRTVRPLSSLKGGFVAVQGHATPLHPLTSRKSRTPCLYYHFVEQVQESLRFGSEAQAGWRTVVDDEQLADFVLDDGTGKALVLGHGAQLMFRQREDAVGTTAYSTPAGVGLGPVSVQLRLQHGDRRRETETVVDPGVRVTVVGGASRVDPPPREASGTTVVFSSANPAPLFIIGDRPRDELAGTLLSRATLCLAGAGVLGALAVFLALSHPR